MPLLADRAQFAIKQEAVAGTAETLLAVNAVLAVGRPTFTAEIEIAERQALTASLSKRGHVTGARVGRISASMHLRGTSGAPVNPTNLPDFTVPFLCCGAQPTVSGTTPNEQTEFKPNTALLTDETNGTYCTVGIFIDGKLYQIHGAVGTCSLTLRRGVPVLAEFEFTGIYNTPTDAALLVPTYPTIVEPPFAGAGLTFMGFANARIEQITLNFGNVVAMRPSPNTASGLFTAQIVDRKPVGTIDPEEVLAATENWWADFIAGTKGALDTAIFPSGGTNYNQLRLQVPNMQYSGIALADREQILTAGLDFVALANSDAGDDEWSLIQT